MIFLFDIGATNSRISFSLDGENIDEIKSFPTPKKYSDGLDLLVDELKNLPDRSTLTTIVGCFPGLLSDDKQSIYDVYNLPDWKGKPLADDLSKEGNCTVYLENDCALEGLGEAVYGAGKNSQIVAYMTVGTGVGGVRIVNKKIDVKKYGFEPGHQIISFEKELHLGDLVSGGGLRHQFNINAKEINDPIVWRKATRILSYGVFNMILFWSPDIVVLGGGMVLADRISIEEVRTILKELCSYYPDKTEIVRSQLGEKAGLLGALHYANQRLV